MERMCGKFVKQTRFAPSSRYSGLIEMDKWQAIIIVIMIEQLSL